MQTAEHIEATSGPGDRGQDAPGLGTNCIPCGKGSAPPGKEGTPFGTEGILPSRRAGSSLARGFALALVFVFLCATPSAQAATALADLITTLETSERFDPDKVAAVYREAVVSGASIDSAVARLSSYASSVTLSPEGQARCHLAIAHLQWREGASKEAVASAEKALSSSPTPGALLLKARLLDAVGDADAAREWYQRAAEAFDEGGEQWLIRVRLAMMDASSRNVEDLEELAAKRDQTFRNKAAVVLALLGRPDRSIELYQPLAEAGKLYQQHIRLSEWALQVESHELAREQAWLAYAAAPVRSDRLYALSLLAESYRSAGELDRLIEDLASRDPEDQDLLRLRVETLTETEDHHQAIELYEQLEGTEAGIAERRRLVALHEAAGDTDAMVREYRRLLDLEPAQVQWYDDLAAHYLNRADNDAALEVWDQFQAHNGKRPGVLVEGARLMLRMGFVDESVAMLERHMQGHGPDVGVLLFLFETWLNRGEDEPALEALVRLEAFLPADAAELVELADAYERLSRPEEALRVFEAIRDTRGELGYDDRMRLAWLYTLVDRKREALDLWRDIWIGVESPARRSLAESQLLLLAAELGALGDMAVELEGMLIEGTANRNHMNLLVRIYTESGDQLSATESIDEYAEAMGVDEVGHQQLLANVYMLLKDYPAHNKALRKLYEIDPVNRNDHIKSIIINLLTFDLATEINERFEEIQHWVAELRKFDEESVTGEFEAGIYSMAGFAEQAVEAYRRALVEQPQESDNLLLLADVMDKSGQSDEAVAILQFFAENAVEDNEFVVAVDGILNLIGTTTFFQQPDPEVQDTLEWTKRVILERIAGRANKFYLYELLADIAREQGDTEASFVALENSLAEAGLRRPAVLRELLTMATPNAGFGGFSTGGGDIDRQLKYGRRLVGLRQQLPPEVYIDVGKSLLAREDVSGAERAFEMIDDITGMIDIDRTKAEIFEQAGYEEQSRVFYNRALNVNRDSLDLLHKTGFLYEVIGRDEVAFKRYMQAIGDVLRRQSTVLAAARPVDPNSIQAMMNQRTDTTVSREYREHYASLEQGLLLSWPEDVEESEAAAAELKALFETELRNVLERSEDELLPLARYPRLDRTARLIRKVGFFLADDELARYADRKLLDHFGDDWDFAGHLVQVYGEAGRSLPEGVTIDEEDSALAALSPLRRQLALAEKREDFETQLQLLRLDGATGEMETLLGERILEGEFRDALGYGMAFLGEAAFKRHAHALASKLAVDTENLLRLVGSDPQLFLRAEEVLGQPLVPAKDIISLLAYPEEEAPSSRRQAVPGGLWEFLTARGTLDDRVRYFKEFPQPEFFFELLQEDLTEAQRDEIANRIIAFLSDLEELPDQSTKKNVLAFMPLNARRKNAEVLYRIAEFAERRWPALAGTGQLMEATYEGRLDEAFRWLVKLIGDLLEERAAHRGRFFSGYREILAEPRLRIMKELATGQYVDPGLARAAYDIEFLPLRNRNTTRAGLERQLHVLDNLRRLEPEEDLHHVHFIETLVALRRLNSAGRAINAEYRAFADERNWRLAYFLLLRAQQRFHEALAVATHRGADLRDSQTLMQLITAQTAPRNEAFGYIVRILFYLGLPGVGAPPKSPEARLRAALSFDNHQAGRPALREAWRRLLAPRNSPHAPAPGSQPLQRMAHGLLNARLLNAAQDAVAFRAGATVFFPISGPLSPLSPSQPRLLLDAVAETGYGADELERYLRAMPDATRKGFHPLYGHLAKALYVRSRQQELWSRLERQQIDDHEFTLWMLLRERQHIGLAPGELDAFEQRLADLSDPSPYQLLLAARTYAAAGAAEQAAEYYKLLAARRIQHMEFADFHRVYERASRMDTEENSSIASLLELFGEIAARLPRPVARGCVESILALARRADFLPGSDALFDALALASLEKFYPPRALLKQAADAYPGILALPHEPTSAGVARTAELIRAYARSGNWDRATKMLGALLVQPASRIESPAAIDFRRPVMRSAMRNTRLLYGIRVLGIDLDGNATGSREILERQNRLFPDDPNDWPDIEAWIAAMESALLVWLAEGQADQEDTLELLTALGMRWLRVGKRDQARDLLNRIIESLGARGQPLSETGVRLLVSLAYASGSTLPFEIVAGVLQDDRLSWRTKILLVRIFEHSEERTKMLNLIRDLGIDHGLEMLRLLHAMAEQSADAAYARDLEQRIEREEAAMKVILPGQGQDQSEESTGMAVTQLQFAQAAAP